MANGKRTDGTMEGRRDGKKRGRSVVDLADENIDSGDDSDNNNNEDDASLQSSSSEDNETDLAAKKVRIAREYLERIEAGGDDDDSSSVGEEVGDEDGDDEENSSKLGRRLRDRRLEQTGTLETFFAEKVSQRVNEIQVFINKESKAPPVASAAKASVDDAEMQARAWVSSGQVKLWRGHDMTPTCVALQNDGSRALSGSKDHSVLLWDIETSHKISVLCPHFKKQGTSSVSRTDGQVLSVACSDDGRYAAVGSRDAVVRIFDIRSSKRTNGELTMNMVKEFHGHKGAVTALCFQSNTSQLFSASEDRIIKSYNLTEMVQLETLYGHQLGVTAMDCYQKERPVSVGQDRTARAWKLSEDTHMIYRGGGLLQPAESVSIVKDDWFLSGHQDGQISLWATEKKKPVFSWEGAHGETAEGIKRSVVSISALKRSDLALTGSNDGFLRFWKVRMGASKTDGRDVSECCQIPIHGFVNSIAVGPHAKFALLAVGNEHRMGRWNQVPRARNRLAFVNLTPPLTEESAGEE